jgi:proline iminopeptidase
MDLILVCSRGKRVDVSGPINQLLKLRVEGVEEWLLIRGRDRSQPVLVVVQAGPGLPMIHEARSFEDRLQLENEFVVVYWDQRGCGKSFSPAVPPESLHLDQLVADTRAVIEAVQERVAAEPVLLLGFSFGATVATLTAARWPALVRALITVGMDIDLDAGEREAYQFATAQARQLGNVRALRELERIGQPPHLDPDSFGTRVKWVANFGGADVHETYTSLLRKTIWRMLRAPEYTPLDVVRTLRGVRFVQRWLLPRLAGLNLLEQAPRVEVPTWMLQGRLDRVAPAAVAERYAAALVCPPGKQLVWFEGSAHQPQYEESARFRDVVLAAAASTSMQHAPNRL